jgi:hypothetical protein
VKAKQIATGTKRRREAEARGGGTDITDMAWTDFDLAQEVKPFLVDFLDLVPRQHYAL